MKILPAFKWFSLITAASLLLSGCGTLEVYIEPGRVENVAVQSPAVTPLPPLMPELNNNATPMPTYTAPAALPTLLASNPRSAPGEFVRIQWLKMFDASSGWGLGQTGAQKENSLLLRTYDGGVSWQDRTPPTAARLAAVFAGSLNQSWAVFTSDSVDKPDVIIWRTTDGGDTWSPGQPLDFGDLPRQFTTPTDLAFSDDRHGWVLVHLGSGMSHDNFALFTTEDGGKTWQRTLDAQNNSDLMACSKTGVAFLSNRVGWLAGDCPGLADSLFLYRSEDGTQWQRVDLPTPAGQPSDIFEKAANGCGVPALLYQQGVTLMLTVHCNFPTTDRPLSWLYRSENGGDSWVIRPLPIPYGQIRFTNERLGWLIGSYQNDPTGSGELFRTTDGGQSWTSVLALGWQGVPCFTDAQTGWVVARLGDKSTLVTSTNGGATWRTLRPVVAP